MVMTDLDWCVTVHAETERPPPAYTVVTNSPQVTNKVKTGTSRACVTSLLHSASYHKLSAYTYLTTLRISSRFVSYLPAYLTQLHIAPHLLHVHVSHTATYHPVYTSHPLRITPSTYLTPLNILLSSVSHPLLHPVAC